MNGKKGNTALQSSKLPKICNLDAGVYTFLIWNKDSCVLTKTIEVKSSNLTMNFVYTTTNTTNCASAKGGLSVTTLTTANGTAPVTFSWFQGNALIAQGNPPPVPRLQILEAGNYKIVATDANGCSVSKPFVIGVKDDISVSFSDITAPCPNGTNGIINATASPKLKLTGAFYTYTWGAPINLTESNVASSRVQGLKSGTYILTVSTNGGKCQKVVNYTLQAKAFSSTDITATIKNACHLKSNGSITLNTQNLGVGATFSWASPPINASMSHQATQLSLPAANNYQVSVTNACGQTAVAIFEVKEVGSFSLTTVTDTKCRTEVKGNFINAQAPIKYKWANGLVTNSLAENPSIGNGTQYSVTAIDANGCTGMGMVSEVQTWNVSTLKACAGPNGRMTIHVHNPKNDSLKVKAVVNQKLEQYNLKYDPNGHHWYHTDPITDLSTGLKFPIIVQIGTCIGRDTVIIPRIESTKKFSGVVKTGPDKGKCQYYEYCDKDYVRDSSGNKIVFSQKGDYKIEGCTRYLTCPNLENPSHDDYQVKDESFDTIMPIGQVIAFLENEKIINPSKAEQANGVIVSCYRAITEEEDHIKWKLSIATSRKDSTNAMGDLLTLCTKIRFCKLDYYTYAFARRGAEKTANPVTVDNFKRMTEADKPKSSDGGLTYTYNCNGNNNPPYIPTSTNGIHITLNPFIDNCDIDRERSMEQLYIWYNDLEARFPLFRTSELKAYLDLDAIKNNPKRTCARISYCKTDFKIDSRPNFDKIYCDILFNKPENEFCKIHSSSPRHIKCFKGKDKELFGNEAYFDKIILDDNPRYNGLKSNTGTGKLNIAKERNAPSYQSLRLLANVESTVFQDFAYLKNDSSYYYAHGILKNESGTSEYYNFLPASINMNNMPYQNFKFIINDLENDEELTVVDNVKGKFSTLTYIKADKLLNISITADSLNISKVVLKNNKIFVAGYFINRLAVDFEDLASSDKLSAFIMNFDLDGNLLEHKTIKDVSEQNSLFYENDAGFGLSGIANNGVLDIDNQPVTLNHQNSLFDVSNGIIDSEASINGVPVFHKIVKNHTTNETYYLISKKVDSPTDIQIANVTIKNNELALIAFDTNKNINWVKKITTANNNPDLYDFVIDDENIYLSITFENDLVLGNTTIHSIGGKDIVIAKLSLSGVLINYKHYGSPDNETVRKIFKTPYSLVIGGEVEGSTWERQIGETTFLNYNNVPSQAYMTIISDSNFKTEKTGGKVAKTNNINAPLSVDVVPNPFNESLLVSIHCEEKCNFEIRLVDILGRTRWYRKEANLSSFEIENASKLEAGIYFLEVKDDNGTQLIQRLVKQ